MKIPTKQLVDVPFAIFVSLQIPTNGFILAEVPRTNQEEYKSARSTSSKITDYGVLKVFPAIRFVGARTQEISIFFYVSLAVASARERYPTEEGTP